MLTVEEQLLTVLSDATSWGPQGSPSFIAYVTAFEIATHFALRFPAEAKRLVDHMDEVNPPNPQARENLIMGLITGPDGDG